MKNILNKEVLETILDLEDLFSFTINEDSKRVFFMYSSAGSSSLSYAEIYDAAKDFLIKNQIEYSESFDGSKFWFKCPFFEHICLKKYSGVILCVREHLKLEKESFISEKSIELIKEELNLPKDVSDKEFLSKAIQYLLEKKVVFSFKITDNFIYLTSDGITLIGKKELDVFLKLVDLEMNNE